MIRVLLPYALGLIAVLAVLAFYLKVTGEVGARAEDAVEDRALQVAWELSRLASDSTTASLMFMSYTQEDQLFRRLKPDFADLLELDDFTCVMPLEDRFTAIPFGRDTLAERAVVSGEIQMRSDAGQGEAGSLTVFFPASVDSGTVQSLSRMQLSASAESISFDRYRYMFFILTAAVIVLIIVPAVILRLADLRRRMDLDRFAVPAVSAPGGPQPVPETPWNDAGPHVPSLREGSPALIRIDGNGSILDLNPSAMELLDISRDAATGMLFHRLPGLRTGGSEKYPDAWRSGSFRLEQVGGSGSLRGIRFTVEPQERDGYLLVGHPGDPDRHDADPGAGTGAEDRLPTDPTSRKVPDLRNALDRILVLAEEGCSTVDPASPAAQSLRRIRELVRTDGAASAPDVPPEPPTVDSIELTTELDRIALALNDVLPERAVVEVDSPGFLPEVRFTRQDLTQLIKNMVFYSLESVQGQVRIRITAREVSSPCTDSVFSARCDRATGSSVSLCYTDGARMPVRLKEALLDSETDSSGIRRDFGSHIAAAAEILSAFDCYPVFTEGTPGTRLHILLPVVDGLRGDPVEREPHALPAEAVGMSVVICDASRAVRESVSEALSAMGLDAVPAEGVEELLAILDAESAGGIVLDASVLERDAGQVLRTLRRRCPQAGIVITTRPSGRRTIQAGPEEEGLTRVEKPYTPLELLEALLGPDREAAVAGSRAGRRP